MNIIVGRKLNMSQWFAESGEVVPVTVVKAAPVTVTRIKQKTGKDGYDAVQVGVSKSIGGTKHQNKAQAGQVKNLGKFGKVMEFNIAKPEEFNEGQKFDISSFQVGELVNVSATSKGRGFAGVMKRHNFAGFPASHGHDRPRSVGSIGQRWPQHVRKGMRMAGRMGSDLTTVKNLQIVEVDASKNLITLKGAVPGTRNGMVKIVSTGKVKPVVKVIEVKDEKKKK